MVMSSTLLIFAIALAVANLAAAQEWHFAWNESAAWNQVRKKKIAYTKTLTSREVLKPSVDLPDGGTEGSELIGGQPVYVSLTTIANRLHLLSPTIQSIISGSVVPTMIYVFISREPHLIDTGIQESELLKEELKLVQLLDYFQNIKFVYTENIGPHRKVLPLLYHKQTEDCVIISVDDDHIYLHHWLRDMLAYHVHAQGQAIISTRARRIAICSGQQPYSIAPYMRTTGSSSHTQWYEAPPHVQEMLLLPTGVGGVLYRPRFFDLSLAFNRELWGNTLRADDLTFRLATLAKKVPVYTACIHGDYKDHRLITECPSLRGVAFQHLARRRLEGSGLPLHLHQHAPARSDEGKRRGEGERGLRGKAGHKHQRHHEHHHQQQHQRQQQHEDEDKDESEDEDQQYQEERTANGGKDGGGMESPEQRRASVRSRSGIERRPGTYAALRGSGHRAAPVPGNASWYRNLYSKPRNDTSRDGTDPVAASPGVFNRANRTSSATEGSSSTTAAPPVVYNRTALLALNPNLRPPPKNIDHGKQGSLSGINSKRDGNFHQWKKATELLKQRGLFDVDALVQQYVRREREPCLATTLLIAYDNSTWLGSVVGALATGAQTVREGWTEQRCGVVTCSR